MLACLLSIRMIFFFPACDQIKTFACLNYGKLRIFWKTANRIVHPAFKARSQVNKHLRL